jgi:hypothetical protein
MKFIIGRHEPEQYCHVLMDPLAVSEKSDHSILQKLSDVLGKHAVTRVIRTDLPQVPHLHPILVCLASPTEPLSTSLLELTARAGLMDLKHRKRSICGWLLSDSPASVIAPHLTSICQLPSGTGEHDFFPIFEPVRLELFSAAFEQVDRGPWWPIKRWILLTSGGLPVSVTSRQGAHYPIPAHARDMQNDAALIEELLAAWRTILTCPMANSLLPLPQVAAVRASEYIQQARKLGLSGADDIQTLALHLLCIHPRLHSHPDVLAMINTALKEQRPLADLFAQYTDANWRYVTKNLSGSETAL